MHIWVLQVCHEGISIPGNRGFSIAWEIYPKRFTHSVHGLPSHRLAYNIVLSALGSWCCNRGLVHEGGRWVLRLERAFACNNSRIESVPSECVFEKALAPSRIRIPEARFCEDGVRRQSTHVSIHLLKSSLDLVEQQIKHDRHPQLYTNPADSGWAQSCTT